ncbi:hypothetical protein ACFPK9_04850 [Rubritalea spongiae]|uniref:Uncharacterized protein n=1 Tax=Rubritalea spongiae TaxID=430797 RepID=A0ABW5EBA1_9BACT
MTISQPESLSLGRRFKQAKKLAKETSRVDNPNWYADAFSIDLQLHIFVGSDSGAISYIRTTSTGEWAKGPNISVEMEEDPTLLQPVLDGIVKEHLSDTKHPALGVILYVADEFATAEPGPEHQNPAEIDTLRLKIQQDPRAVLEDASVSNTTHSWRLFPYPGAASGQAFATAISFTRRHEALLQEFRGYGNRNNIPIKTRAISAPLCAIAALPWLLEQKPENGFVAIHHYPRFSVLSYFNIHGDLVLIRTLQHHGNVPFSPQTASAIMTSATSLELENPHVFVIPMAGAAPMGMTDSLASMLPNSEVITLSPTSSALHIHTAPSAAKGKNESLGMTRPWKWSDLTAQTALESEPTPAEDADSDTAIPGVTRPWKIQDMAAVAMLSQVRLEVVSTTNPPSASNSVLAENHTFKTLVEEMWPIQDFLPPSEQETTLYPAQVEMKLLKWSKFLKIAAVAALALVAFKSGWDILSATKDPAWGYVSYNPQYEIMMLKKKAGDSSHLNTLLSDRSRGWTAMEVLPALFPENSGVTVSNFEYDAKITPADASNKKIPVSRLWKITGTANNKGKDLLDKLNTRQGIEEVFKQIKQNTGDSSFNPELFNRTPIANIGITYSASGRDGNSSPYKFNMTLRQSFNNQDPLTLPAK